MFREIVSLKAGDAMHYECGLDGCTRVLRAYNLALAHATWVHLTFVEREKVKDSKGEAVKEVRYKLRRPSLDELSAARVRIGRSGDLKSTRPLEEAQVLLDRMYRDGEATRTSLELGWAPAIKNIEECEERAKDKKDLKKLEKEQEEVKEKIKIVRKKVNKSSAQASAVVSENEGEPVAKKIRGRPKGSVSKPVSSDETDSEYEENSKFVSSSKVSRTVSTRSSRAVSEERIEEVSREVRKKKSKKS